MILDGRDTRPWIRWWWLGSALTPNEIARQLEQLRGAGFGGVEIQPIYAASPPWCPSVDYLSPVWVELLVHTLREAGRLGLGVDLTTGSGWPWGGPGLETQHAAWKLVIRTTQAPETVVDIPAVIQGEPGCVVAVTASLEGATAGEPAHVIRPDWPGREGRFHARLGPGVWSLTVARQVPTGQQVKRASPGAEGPVVDHFSRQAVGAFLRRFDPLLRSLGTQLPRAAFTDSYEVYGADWTPRLPEAFRSARGYDLEPWLRYLDPGATDGLCRRVVHDYRQTLRELQIQALDVWIDWCREHGMRSRLQAHGSPGQLLDLYARADIPETEGFGKEGVVERFGRFASSAAHLAGRVLCSAEAFTWLDDHFRTGPDHMRQEADRYFLCGINHLVFHGAPTTPEGMPFPGQLFYAGIDVSEHMPWFQDLGPLCAYIGRAQAALRWGRPDPDVLLFHPIHDVLFAPPEAGQKDNWGYLTTCGAHNTQSWLDAEVKPFAETDRALEAPAE